MQKTMCRVTKAFSPPPWLSSQPTERTTLSAPWVCHLGIESYCPQVSYPRWSWVEQRWAVLAELCQNCRFMSSIIFVVLSHWALGVVYNVALYNWKATPSESLLSAHTKIYPKFMETASISGPGAEADLLNRKRSPRDSDLVCGGS